MSLQSVNENKNRNIISGKIQLAILVAFVSFVIGSLIMISAGMTQLTNTAMKSELNSVGYLAIESIKDGKGSDFTYDAETGAFYCGNRLINRNYYLLESIKKETECRLCFFWGKERIYSSSSENESKWGNHTFIDDEKVWDTVSGGKSFFVTNTIIDSEPYCSLYLPVKQTSSGEVVGMLSIGKPMAVYDEFTADIKLFCGIILILLTFMCSYFLYRYMSKKMDSITVLNEEVCEIVNEFGNDFTDLSKRATIKHRDEVGILAHSFNLFFMKMENMFSKWKNCAEEIQAYIHSTQNDIKSTMEKISPEENKQNHEIVSAIHKVEKNLDVLESMATNMRKEFDRFQK